VSSELGGREGSWKVQGRSMEGSWEVHGRLVEGSWKKQHTGIVRVWRQPKVEEILSGKVHRRFMVVKGSWKRCAPCCWGSFARGSSSARRRRGRRCVARRRACLDRATRRRMQLQYYCKQLCTNWLQVF